MLSFQTAFIVTSVCLVIMSYIGATQIYNLPPVFKFRAAKMGGRGQANKSLFTTDEEDDTPSDDAIKVFLRLKPSNKTDDDIINVLDSKTVLFKMPQEFAQAQKRLNIPAQVKYTFSKIFQTNVTQSEIFNGCVSLHIKDLFSGGHCLLFTYGTTNAGKTFTVLGTGSQPGIIPRTLTTVFKSIKGKEYRSARIMPHMFNSALQVRHSVYEEEQAFKKRILTWSHEKSQSESSRIGKSHVSSVQSCTDEIIDEAVFREMQRRLTNDTDIIDYDAEPDERFSVWVSFAEIYNELIFDLLQPVTNVNCKRKPLKLSQDSNNRNTYIKGLKHIFVQSEEEAYKVLMFGKNNLQVAATGMNNTSSRSHCIFSIKLIKCPNVESPEKVLVSSFSICDLAGAERQKKTLNVGLRLKESQNINCSLHVLSRCFSIIRENQLNNEIKLIPFRDSKLTQLFQHALQGKESVTMIVNVNSDHHLCEETQHVLKASAIAKHIVVQPRLAPRPPRATRQSIFSQIISKHNRSTLIRWDSCVRPKAPGESSLAIVDDGSSTQEPSEQESKQDKYEVCLALVEDLKEKLKEEKSKHCETKTYWKEREVAIREEMKLELKGYIDEAKKQNELDLKRTRSVTEEDGVTGERLIGPVECVFKKPKQIFNNPLEDDVFQPDVNELLDEIKMQQKQIEGLTDYINIQQEEKKELTMNLTSAKLQLGWKDKEIKNLNNKIEMFCEESELRTGYVELEKEMESRVKGRDVLLEEARDDLLAEMRQREDLEEEVAKLEAELSEKEEKLLAYQSETEDLKQELAAKASANEALQQQLDELQLTYDEDVKNFESHVTRLETQLNQKEEQIKNLEVLSSQHKSPVNNLELEGKIELLEQQLQSLTIEKTEINYRYENSIKHQQQENLKIHEDFEEHLSKTINDLQLQHKSEVSINEDLINKLKLKVDEHLDKLTTLENELKRQDENAVAVIIKTSDEYDEKLKNIVDDYESKILEKENIIENIKKSFNDQSSEVSVLEKNLKDQIQDAAILKEDNINMKKLNYHLNKKLTEAKIAITDFNVTLKNKEHELECCKSEITGYQSSIPALQAEFERQRLESSSSKRREEDLQATNCNLEQEIDSFRSNQKEIIGKYEEQLKKTKEENENLKKEVARVTSTFYKSTPTPKKDLEKQLEDMKKQLEDAQNTCQKLKLENDSMRLRRLFLEEQENIKVNEDVFTHGKDSKTSKSAQKVKTRRMRATRAATADFTDFENDKPNEKAQKPQKKLFTASVQDISAQSDEEDGVEVIPQGSPRTNIKMALRQRHNK